MEKKIELTAPAGNPEKLIAAVEYGADAVYLAGKEFGLRRFAGNFDNDSLRKAVEFAHSRGKRVYITLNIFARNIDFAVMRDYLDFLNEIKVDAVIVSDPGVLMFIKKYAPPLTLHLSTQANTTNKYSVEFWRDCGVKRIILARELNISEIKEIREYARDIELEIFAHGAVCISYSGRCFLSRYMTGRDANSGECTHPCRWKYYLMEEKRDGEYFKIEEDLNGSYIFNSKDLNTVSLLPEFAAAGIDSLKIEGRMKSVYYTAAVTAVYRNAIDLFYENSGAFSQNLRFYEDELRKVSHRKYYTGFYKQIQPSSDDYNYKESTYYRNYDFVGVVCGRLEKEGRQYPLVEVRSKIFKGDTLEILDKNLLNREIRLDELLLENFEHVDFVNHGRKIILTNMPDIAENSMLRRKKNEKND